MRVHGYEWVGFLALCFFCALISSYRFAEVKSENQRDVRVAFKNAEQWMIQSLPGIGPVKSAEIIAARDAGVEFDEIKWPKRSQPYIDKLFTLTDY